jgi:hypothetical protein
VRIEWERERGVGARKGRVVEEEGGRGGGGREPENWRLLHLGEAFLGF